MFQVPDGCIISNLLTSYRTGTVHYLLHYQNIYATLSLLDFIHGSNNNNEFVPEVIPLFNMVSYSTIK